MSQLQAAACDSQNSALNADALQQRRPDNQIPTAKTFKPAILLVAQTPAKFSTCMMFFFCAFKLSCQLLIGTTPTSR